MQVLPRDGTIIKEIHNDHVFTVGSRTGRVNDLHRLTCSLS
jgi:hypothetical protein